MLTLTPAAAIYADPGATVEERVEIIWRDAPDAELVKRAATAERERVAALNATG
jgi:hypothetical protein